MPRKILIVDDNAINRQLLINTLQKDYDILEAENGREALEMIHRYYKMLSAILLDIVMPEIDGYEVMRRVRDNVLLSQIPIIVVTGSEDEESRVKALSYGANDFILKPFNPDIVKHCLKNNIALRETASILNAIQKDKLTGLYNREAFFEKVTGLIADKEPGYYVLSCFDIDNFKLINDQYGATEGDRILREIGKALFKNVEKIGGIGGRISADNFAALFPADQKNTEVLQQILDKTLVSIEQQSVSFSIGRYEINDTSLPASAIYDRAFIAKQSVKGRYDEHLAYFDDTMLERLVREQQMTGEMEIALENRQFEAWFQPQYNHATGALLGAEALVRWRHPQKGIIPPNEFIPLFEQNGFVYELDKYVWREVCASIRSWIDKGYHPIPVSVNISRYDIFRANLIEVLTGLIEEYQIPVDLLHLEVTESAFAFSSERIVSIVKELISLGFTVEIDDFGSGYSSLNTLKNVPAQVVKLDMRFLEGGDDSQRGGNILESIVRMAKWLGMTVLAEGVEELDQADFLKSIGCTYVQGYLYAKPMPATEFEQLLAGVTIEQHPFVSVSDRLLLNDAFWDPKSVDSVIFNKYSGGACVYEFYDGKVELIRATDKYIHTVFGQNMSATEAMKLDWGNYVDQKSREDLSEALFQSIRTRDEVTGDYLFVGLPGCPPKTYLRSSLRVIASTDDRYLVYCASVNITPQREAEEKSMAVAEQLKAVMDNVSCGITAITYQNEEIHFLLINTRYYELFGYQKEQYATMDPFAPIYEEDRSQVKELSRQVYKQKEPATIEYRAIKQDGSMIWIRASLTMTSLTNVAYPVQLGMFSDITAEKHVTKELLDNLPGGAALYEYDGKDIYCLHVNQRYWELVNRAPIDYTGQSIFAYIHQEDQSAVRKEAASAIREQRDISCDLRVLAGKGEYRPFHVAGRIVMKSGNRYTINALYTPISDAQMSIQQMLPIALQAVMNSSSEISFVKDSNLQYLICSRNFATLVKRKDEAEITGKTAKELFHSKQAMQFTKTDRIIIETGKSVVDEEVLIPYKSKVRHLLFSKYPLLDPQGNILGIYGTGRDITETRETRSRLELLTNNIPGGIAVYEGQPDALDKIRLSYFSDGFCRLFGYTREEYEKLAERNPLGLVFSADLSTMMKKVLELVKEGIPLDYVYRAKVNGETYKWINVKAVMGEPNAQNLTVNAVFFDVTESRSALEKLRVSEEVNRLALQQSKNVVCQYDIESGRLLISPNADPIFEVSDMETDVPESLIAQNKISAETVDALRQFFTDIRQGKKSGDVLYQRKSSNGWRWVEAHFTTIFSDSKEPITAVISYTDVTESIEKEIAYKKWRQSLKGREPKDYSLYHCNVSKDTILDATEGLLLPTKWRTSGLSLSARTMHYVNELVYHEDREQFLAIMEHSKQLLQYKQGKRTNILEYREQLPDGQIRWLKLTVDLIDLPYSADVEAYLLFENIDIEKRAAIEMYERAQTDPLTGVLNRTAFAERVNQLIHTAQPFSKHALLMLDVDSFKLVNDVFGHGAGDATLIDIATLLQKAVRKDDLVGRLGGDEFIVFLTGIPNDAIAAKKAQQICETIRKNLSAEVQISGSIGIARYPQDANSFEELYQKADETLYYVKRSGKNNYAFYQEDRKGIIATLQPAEPANEPVMNQTKRRMLIVDDNKIDCKMLENHFKELFVVEKALGGAMALSSLEQYGNAISVILLDLIMPKVDGYMVLERIQQNPDWRDIPVIVVSGSDDAESNLKAIKAGAWDYISKPVDPDVLQIRVNSAISKAENERLRAHNSYLKLQCNEMGHYQTVLEKSGMILITFDCLRNEFSYHPSLSQHWKGSYDHRPLWQIFTEDEVTDKATIAAVRVAVDELIKDYEQKESCITVRLCTTEKTMVSYDLHLYKQTDDYGVNRELLLLFCKAG